MSNEQDNTAVVAIIIALIAFFVTTAQLLQALFGTAEGYRRCQPSVIGRWAEKTRRKWRWSEFRFETMFTTPDIHLGLLNLQYQAQNMVFIEGSESSRVRTYLDGTSLSGRAYLGLHHVYSDTSQDLASWFLLLDMLHCLQYSVFHNAGCAGLQQFNDRGGSVLNGNMSCPAIRFRTRSWDFMPPEIVRPFATSNIGDIIALAHRLGMRWKEMRPDDGVVRAEGTGQSITSTTVRGFGLLLQYTVDQGIIEKLQRTRVLYTLTIPSNRADMLGFQIVPGSRNFRLPDFVFDNSLGSPKVTLAMENLGVGRNARRMYAHYVQRSGRLYGFSDLIGLVTPFLPLPGSSIVRVFSPYSDVHDSPTNWWEGFVVYHTRLLKYIEEGNEAGHDSKQMRWVLDRFEYMRRSYPWNQCPSWVAESVNNKTRNGRSIQFLNDLRDIWSATTTYFHALETKHHHLESRKGFRYIDLVGAHIAQAVYYPDLADANIKAGKNKRYELGVGRSKRVAEGMHIYVDQIPKVVEFMKEKGFDNESVVREAWWTLMLRAMCWHRSVAFIDFQESTPVPPSFHGSRIPVYIA